MNKSYERRNEMKKFETPVLEVEKFEIMDVITTSTGATECGQDGCDLDAPGCGDDLGMG